MPPSDFDETVTGLEAPCVFCAIVAGDSPAFVVYEDEHTIAFLDIHPAAAGHTLVIPRAHALDVFDIDVEAHAEVARAVHRVAGLLDRRLAPDGMTIGQANRPAGWQTVFHLHVHVIPRYLGDGLVPPWSPHPGDRDQLESIRRSLVGPLDGSERPGEL